MKREDPEFEAHNDDYFVFEEVWRHEYPEGDREIPPEVKLVFRKGRFDREIQPAPDRYEDYLSPYEQITRLIHGDGDGMGEGKKGILTTPSSFWLFEGVDNDDLRR